MEQTLRRIRILLIVNTVLVALLYAWALDLALGGPVGAWISRARAEQAQRQVEQAAYEKWLSENKR